LEVLKNYARILYSSAIAGSALVVYTITIEIINWREYYRHIRCSSPMGLGRCTHFIRQRKGEEEVQII
jgi:hypothetical protein